VTTQLRERAHDIFGTGPLVRLAAHRQDVRTCDDGSRSVLRHRNPGNGSRHVPLSPRGDIATAESPCRFGSSSRTSPYAGSGEPDFRRGLDRATNSVGLQDGAYSVEKNPEVVGVNAQGCNGALGVLLLHRTHYKHGFSKNVLVRQAKQTAKVRCQSAAHYVSLPRPFNRVVCLFVPIAQVLASAALSSSMRSVLNVGPRKVMSLPTSISRWSSGPHEGSVNQGVHVGHGGKSR
jgi:hypothetical protein